MPYRLYKGVFAVRCRHSPCSFDDHVRIEADLLGVTEEDVRAEAYRMAKDQAATRHDSQLGRRGHSLESPEVRMVSGTIQRIGGTAPAGGGTRRGMMVRQFRKGEAILKKGEAAGTVCEVLSGSAYPAANRSHRYEAGDCFGVAALVPHRTRLSDVIAGADETAVAFYDLGDLRQSEPDRANQVVARVMEDTLHVVEELGRAVDRLRRQHKAAS
ncbi:MAG TPA: hypothetical protein VFI08_12800 [Spirochaetia bacterium]|nr:hypothetical protein [Spirochaetia bacterium]